MANAQFLLEAASPKYGTWGNSPLVLLQSITKNINTGEEYTYYTVASSISINPNGNDIYIANAPFNMIKQFLPDNTISTRYEDTLITGLMIREAIFDYRIIKPDNYIQLVELIFDRDTVKVVNKPLTSVEINKQDLSLILQSNVTVRI